MRDDLQPANLGAQIGAVVSLDHPEKNVDAVLRQPQALVQHRVGLANSGCGPEIHVQPAASPAAGRPDPGSGLFTRHLAQVLPPIIMRNGSRSSRQARDDRHGGQWRFAARAGVSRLSCGSRVFAQAAIRSRVLSGCAVLYSPLAAAPAARLGSRTTSTAHVALCMTDAQTL